MVHDHLQQLKIVFRYCFFISLLSVWDHVSVSTILRPTEMFLVCIVKGFPVLQSHSTTETSDFVSYLCIDKTSSCQISCVGPSQILWPILETGYAIHIVHVLLVLPDTIHGLFDWSWGSNVLFWDLDGITVVAGICCIVSHKPRESRTGVYFNATTINAGCHFENDTKSFHSAIYITFFQPRPITSFHVFMRLSPTATKFQSPYIHRVRPISKSSSL